MRPSALSLLAVMSGSGDPVLLDYAPQKLLDNPALVQERCTHGRTLVHEVAARVARPSSSCCCAWARTRTPWMRAKGGDGAAVVHVLAQGGADVNARASVKQCTTLHMAARRGSIPVAAALLDCKADLEGRDRAGDTPLRRAVNCRKKETAAFLLSRGAMKLASE